MINSEQTFNEYHAEQIWRINHAQLHNFIQKRAMDISHTDDIFQEVFMEIYNCPDLLEKRNAMQTRIYSTTRWVILNSYRDFDEIEKKDFFPVTETNPGIEQLKQFTYILLPVYNIIENMPGKDKPA